jgi:HEAT repeat protein
MITLILCLLIQEADVRRARELLELLEHSDADRREQAVRELRKHAIGNAEVDREIEEAYRTGSQESKLRLRAVLPVRVASRLVPDPVAFVDRLTSPNRDVRGEAARRLTRIPGAAVLAVWFVDDLQIAWYMIRILANSGDLRYAEAMRPLIDHPQVGQVALDALGRLGDLSIRPRLHELITSSGNLREAALIALVRMRQKDDLPFLAEILTGSDGSTTRAVVRTLRDWPEGKAALYSQIRGLAEEGLSDAMLVAADVGRKDLTAFLLQECAENRRLAQAAFALAWLGEKDAVPYLLNRARYGPERCVGILGLGRLRAPEAIPLFRRLLGHAEGDAGRTLRAVLSELEVFDGRGQNRVYTLRFGDPQQRTMERVYVAWALGEIGGPEAEAMLLELLDDPSENVRHEACRALGRAKSAKAVAKIVPLLDDATAFRRITPPGETSALGAYDAASSDGDPGEWAQVREAACSALEAITGEKRAGPKEWKEWAEQRK